MPVSAAVAARAVVIESMCIFCRFYAALARTLRSTRLCPYGAGEDG